MKGNLFLIVLVFALILAFVMMGYGKGYNEGYKKGGASVADDIVAQNKAAIEASDWYVEPDDIETRIIEKMIDAMSSAEMDLIIENGDVTSGKIHIYWEKD